MSATHQALLMAAPDAVVYESALLQVFPAAQTSFTSTSYVDVRQSGNSGAFMAVTINKAAGTSLWVAGGMYVTTGGSAGNALIGVSVYDGVNPAVDYDLGARNFSSAFDCPVYGQNKITGLAAGSWTLTLRAKYEGNTWVSGASDTRLLRVIEVAA